MEKENSYYIGVVEPTDLEALREIEDVQVAAWDGMPNRNVVPAHVLEIVAETGGQLLAARTNDTNQVIGFALAFLAKNEGAEKHSRMPEGEIFLASHMVAVLPQYQGGVGFDLKLEQMTRALDRNIRWMQWTYYPMLTKNASLNLRKLGARCYKFVRNKYGRLAGGLYQDLPSDRLVVLWDMRHATPAIFQQGAMRLTWRDSNWRPVLDKSALEAAASGDGPPAITCSVPIEFVALRQRDLDAARAWQESFAQIATRLLTSKLRWAVANFRVGDDKEEGEYLFIREQDCDDRIA